MSFSELQVSEMHIYICKYCFIYSYCRKKQSILDKRDIFIQTEKKFPKTTQYPAKPDQLTSFGKGEFDLVPSKLNYLQCNWEICKVNVIYTKAANFPFISREILLETFIFKQELNICSLQSESNTTE